MAVEGIPEHQASLRTVHDFTHPGITGVKFGGGVRYVGGGVRYVGRIGDGTGNVFVPAVTLFDLMGSYALWVCGGVLGVAIALALVAARPLPPVTTNTLSASAEPAGQVPRLWRRRLPRRSLVVDAAYLLRQVVLVSHLVDQRELRFEEVTWCSSSFRMRSNSSRDVLSPASTATLMLWL